MAQRPQGELSTKVGDSFSLCLIFSANATVKSNRCPYEGKSEMN